MEGGTGDRLAFLAGVATEAVVVGTPEKMRRLFCKECGGRRWQLYQTSSGLVTRCQGCESAVLWGGVDLEASPRENCSLEDLGPLH